VFWVISVYFNIRNTLPKFGTFLLGHPVYNYDVDLLKMSRAMLETCRGF
jgi:hypothetical protein